MDAGFDGLDDAEITSKLKLSLKRRFSHPEWVLMFEYGAPQHVNRVCDAIALNTLPSRNYKVVGFELKASRSDWLREKKDGEKADYFVRLADEWYVLAPKGVVEPGELPDGWGHLELKPNSERIYKIEESDLTDHQQGEPPRRFWINYVDQVVGDDTNFTQADVDEARRRGREDARDDLRQQEHPDVDVARLRRKAESYEDLRGRFDPLPLTGVDEEDLKTLELGCKLAKMMQQDRYGSINGALGRLDDNIERRAGQMRDSVATLQEGMEKLNDRVEEGTVPDDLDDLDLGLE